MTYAALQFGKTGDDEFTMDYTYPFNAIQVRACSVGGVGFVGAGSACKGAALHHAMIHDCFISRIETLKNDYALGVTRDQAFGVVLSSFDSKLACE